MSCSRCFCVLFFTFASVSSVWHRVGKASFSCLCCRYRPQYPVLSAVPVHEVRVFPVFPLVSGLWVSISKHTHILCFQMRLHIYISISRLFVGSLQYAGYVLLLSRLFSFMVSAPFLVGKSLDMTCVHHNTYKAHLH